MHAILGMAGGAATRSTRGHKVTRRLQYCSSTLGLRYAVRSDGVSDYPRAWYRSVSRVRIPPSAHSYKFVGNFSCAHIYLRKPRERELATFDDKSTVSGIAEP